MFWADKLHFIVTLHTHKYKCVPENYQGNQRNYQPALFQATFKP